MQVIYHKALLASVLEMLGELQQLQVSTCQFFLRRRVRFLNRIGSQAVIIQSDNPFNGYWASSFFSQIIQFLASNYTKKVSNRDAVHGSRQPQRGVRRI